METKNDLARARPGRTSCLILASSALLLLLLLALVASDARADDPYGSGWISEVDVNPGINLQEYEPVVASGPGGELWLAYTFTYKIMDDSGGMPIPVGRHGIRVFSSLDGGRSWFFEFDEWSATDSDDDYIHSAIAVASDGTVLVVGTHQTGISAFVYADGEVTTLELAIGDHPEYPSLFIDSSDEAHLAFSGFGWGTNVDLYYMSADLPYAYWSAPRILVGAYDSYSNTRPSVICDDEGRVFIAYERSSDGVNGDIYVLDTVSMEPPWTPRPGLAVSTDVKVEGFATMAVFDGEALLVAWAQEFSDDDWDVRCAISWDHGASFSFYPGFVTTGIERNPRLDACVRAEDHVVKMALEIDGCPYYVTTNPDVTPYSWTAPAMVSDAGMVDPDLGRPAIATYYFEETHHIGGGWAAHCAVVFLESAYDLFSSTEHFIIAAGGASPNPTDVGQLVYFSAFSFYGATPVSYVWDFADGSAASYTPSPSHVYSSPGTYYIRATATDALGYSDYWEAYPVVVYALPSASGSVSPLETDIGRLVHFYCTATGGAPPLSYAWQFDDGGSSTEQNPRHAFSSTGDFRGTVTVTDGIGQKAYWTSQYVHVNPPPSLTCAQSSTEINVHQDVAFTALASEGTRPYSYLWDFGDGSTSTLNNLSHIYDQVGMFLPVCTLTDGVGYSLQCEMGWVVVHESATLTLFATPTQGIAPLRVNYTCYPTGGIPPYTYEWYFGDGGFSDQQNPNHTYAAPGEYKATLVLMDSTQATTTTVEGPLIQVLAELVVEGNASRTLLDTGQDIFFNCTASGGLAPYQVNWSFGDGEWALGPSVVHGYSANGTYHVIATVNDSAAPSNVRTLTLPPIQVNPLPMMVGGPNRTAVDVGLPVRFSCQPLHGTPPYHFAWDFGDGNGSDAQEPEHSWEMPGTYAVTLVLGDSVGAEMLWTGPNITVNPWPSASLSPVPPSGVVPFRVDLTCSVQGGTPPFRYLWDFGDVSGWGEASASHVYVSPGEYNITVWVGDECDVYVSAGPFAITMIEPLGVDASMTPMAVDLGRGVSFNCTVTGGTPPYGILWEFGDGGTSTEPNGTHLYAAPGSYLATLWVNDSSDPGIAINRTFNVQVNALPSVAGVVEHLELNAFQPQGFDCIVENGTPPFQYHWDFGDGNTSDEAGLDHAYHAPGIYNVSIAVVDAFGEEAFWNTAIKVNALPVPFVTVFGDRGVAPLSVRFECAMQGGTPPFNYTWDFGDGSEGYGAVVNHTYLAAGDYMVLLQVLDSVGSMAPAELMVQAFEVIAVQASLSATQAYTHEDVLFECTAIGGLPPYSYLWDFGDGNLSEERNATHSYSSPGSYQVTLNVSDADDPAHHSLWKGSVVRVEVLLTAPSAPLSVIASPGDSRVNLSWAYPASDGGSPITGYKLYRGTAPGGEALIRTLSSLPVSSYVDANVTNGVTYYYRVSAINMIGEGELSEEAYAKPTTVPSAPIGLQAVPGAGRVDLAWSPPLSDGGDAVHYEVHRGTGPSSETLLATLGAVLAYSDVEASEGTTYYYIVRAVNSAGPGPYSNEANATASAPPVPPGAPTGLRVVPGDGQLTLNWTAPADPGTAAVTGYRIYRGTASGALGLLVNVTSMSFVDSNVTKGLTYFYTVSAVSSVGEGAFSAEVQAEAQEENPPPAVPMEQWQLMIVILAVALAVALVGALVVRRVRTMAALRRLGYAPCPRCGSLVPPDASNCPKCSAHIRGPR